MSHVCYYMYIYVYVRRMSFCRKKDMHEAGDPFSDRWSFTSSTKEKIAATWHSYVQIWIEALMLFLRTIRCSTLWAVVENPSCILQRTRQEHLAPLFFLLHRRVAVETIEFGTKLEHAKTLRSKGQNKSKSAFSPIWSMKWQMAHGPSMKPDYKQSIKALSLWSPTWQGKCFVWIISIRWQPQSIDRAAALALGQDFDRETVDAAGADRARIVFPIILDPRNSL